uniref:Uncharacterized protein n=1 Tax=Eutreptiella gymnastica TaxID=73025 RepID=A0A7S4G5M6_9EUGL
MCAGGHPCWRWWHICDTAGSAGRCANTGEPSSTHAGPPSRKRTVTQNHIDLSISGFKGMGEYIWDTRAILICSLATGSPQGFRASNTSDQNQETQRAMDRQNKGGLCKTHVGFATLEAHAQVSILQSFCLDENNVNPEGLNPAPYVA